MIRVPRYWPMFNITYNAIAWSGARFARGVRCCDEHPDILVSEYGALGDLQGFIACENII